MLFLFFRILNLKKMEWESLSLMRTESTETLNTVSNLRELIIFSVEKENPTIKREEFAVNLRKQKMQLLIQDRRRRMLILDESASLSSLANF
jgi:hypothetical protein